MGIKDLFENPKGTKILSSEDFDRDVRKVESVENIEAKFYEKRRFMPNTDFSEPKNFARYGLAKDYYVDSVDRILREYPYDGSEKEKTIFSNSSSYLDHYVFESRYPRTTGYINLSAGGWGSLASGIATPGAALTGEYGKPASVEYIRILGGPHTASSGMESGSLYQSFSGSNIYDTDIYDTEGMLANGRLGTRQSNLQFNSANGCTIEFWMRKFAFAGESLTPKEVIFDLWNQHGTGSTLRPSEITDNKYGRITLELSASEHPATGGDPFRLTVQSGSSLYGFYNQSIADSSVTTTTITDKKWHHYAVTIASASSADGHGTEVKFYVDGKLNNTSLYGTMGVGNITGSLVAHIGALAAAPSGSDYKEMTGSSPSMVGAGKLSASLDEFRFWKVARTDEQILNNYRYQVGGGTNTDISNTELGVYYKFNEGITGTSSVDSTVLDYSGRISNGQWTGYVGSTSRNTGSAMMSASVVSSEYHDPIIYSFHPDVTQLRNDLEATGSLYDHANNSSLYRSMPDWVTDDDQTAGTEELKKLTQIVSSYFDSLHLQIESLSQLKDTTYLSSSFEPAKPLPFADRLLTSKGFVAPELFANADLVAQILGREDGLNFELDLHDIKNFIYKNIYNNLTGIYKSKGTEKAFRNLIRCYGIGDEIVKLKAYANNVVHKLENSHYITAVPKKTINFNDPDHFTATVFQHSGNTAEQKRIAVSGTTAFGDYTQRVDVPFTMECEVVFPKKIDPKDEAYFTTGFVSSSLWGWHRGLASTDHHETLNTFHPDDYNLQVYAVKPEANSNDAYFVLTGANGNVGISIETETYKNVYDNEKWNFAVRGHREKRIPSGRVSGSATGDIDGLISNTVVEFIGHNYRGDVLQESFHLSGNTNITGAIDLLSGASKRFYVGADRTGFTGSVITESDVQISQLRYWQSFLSDQAIHSHARDIHNYGAQNAYRNAFLNEMFADGHDIPQIETLALHWDFSEITGSDSDGRFLVQDVSSGSVDLATRYSNLGKVTKMQHAGLGYGFKTDSTASVKIQYLNTAKQQLPEVVNTSDAVNVLTNDDEYFTRSSAITQYFYTFEKNMYDTISQEMMNMFATIAEYNNLIGEPVYRYRHEYKAMNKLRSLFFERIGNTPDLDKYIEYYKWIDESLNLMLRKLAPISADVSTEVKTIIESHILERNKYQHKYPLIDTRGNRRFGIDDIESSLRGAEELAYDWKHGHAPTSNSQAEHSIWWKQRALRTDAAFNRTIDHRPAEDAAHIDREKEKFRKLNSQYDFRRRGDRLKQIDFAGTQADYSGSTYGLNRFTKPYKLTAYIKNSPARDIKGGYNFEGTRNTDFIINSLRGRVGADARRDYDATAQEENSFYLQSLKGESSSVNTNDILEPAIIDANEKILEKKKVAYTITYGTTPNTKGNDTENTIIARKVAPFALMSSSVTTGYMGDIYPLGVDLAGLHSDGVVDGAMQGPFTERYVGGLQYRHTDLNMSGSDKTEEGDPQGQIKGLDRANTRAEGFILVPDLSTGRLQIKAPAAANPKAMYYRYPVAKRPLNIENIRQITQYRAVPGAAALSGSTNIISGTLNSRMGNFTRINQVVFAGDRGTNNQAFVRNEGFNFGSTGSVYVEQLVDYAKPVRDIAEHTVVERFSSPGGPETAGDAQGGPGLDFVSAQYSPYNNINYRNLSVRLPLRTMLSGVTNQFGLRSGIGQQTNANIYSGLANFHKVHRNTRQRLRISNEFSLTSSHLVSPDSGFPIGGGPAVVETGSVHDNFFVSHPIPQTDLAYSWITSSYDDSKHLHELGYTPADGLSRGGTAPSGFPIYEASIPFASGSENVDAMFTHLERATATITVADGDAASGMTEGEKVTITSTDGTVRVYRLCDDTLTTITTGTELAADSDTGAGTTADAGDIAVVFNIASSEATQNAFLVQLKAAIEHANGHNGKILVSAVPTEANGNQKITLRQAVPGAAGNVAITDDISQTTIQGFERGSSVTVQTTFVGMNTNIVEPVNTSSALVGLPLSQSVAGYINIGNLGETLIPRDPGVYDGARPRSGSLITDYWTDQSSSHVHEMSNKYTEAVTFHYLMLHRNGPYGYPTWKQVRSGENTLSRLLRKNNKISIMLPAEEMTDDTTTPDESHLGTFSSQATRFGETKLFVEPAFTRHSPLKYDFVFTTTNRKGEQVDKTATVKCSFGSTKVKFLNEELNNRVDFHSSEPTYTAYDDIKESYLDGALISADSPIKKLVNLEYKERVYPSERNLGLGKIRGRNKYQSGFWRTNRVDRTKGGERGDNAYSPEYTYKHSMWPLDASVNFEATGSPRSPEYLSDEPIYRPGILQAGHITQMYEYNYGGQGGKMAKLQPGPLYARYHCLSSTASVASPSGMNIPETGAVGIVPPEGDKALWETRGIFDGSAINEAAGYQFDFRGVAYGTRGPEEGLDGETGTATSHTHRGTALWQAPDQAGRVKTIDGTTKFVNEPVEPFYDTYDDYLENIRPHAKKMSVIPEFRISDHMDFYVKQNSENFLADNPQFLSIPGASHSDAIPVNSTGTNFFKIFSFSDFMKHFDVIQSDHEELADPTQITLECSAMKKFLPYDGFYPASRTVQMASQWSASYGPHIGAHGLDIDAMGEAGHHIRNRPLLQSLFAPGILYNSIKAGIACDWPCHTGSDKSFDSITVKNGPPNSSGLISALRTMHGTGSRMEKGWDYRVPFEALIEPERYLANIPFIDMETEIDLTALRITASWGGQGDNLYKLMMNNFLAETSRFFLKKKSLTRIESADESNFGTAVSGTTYTARLKVYRSMNQARPTGAWGNFPIPQDAAYELIPGVSDGSENIEGFALGAKTGLRETFTMYSRPSAFGPPVAGYNAKAGRPFYNQAVFDSNQGYNPSFTPPYYHGQAWADIVWTAQMDGKPTLDEIFSTAKVYNLRIDGEAFWSIGATGNVDPEVADSHAGRAVEFPMQSGNANAYSMQFIHSFNVFGKAKKPLVRRVDGKVVDETSETEESDVWVIEPKWETPMFNFNDLGSYGSRMLSGSNPRTNLIIPSASSGQGTVPRGMWHQFGVMPTSSDEGIFMQIRDVPRTWVNNAGRIFSFVEEDGRTIFEASLPTQDNPGVKPKNSVYKGAKSLVDLCGFRTRPRRLGEVAKRKKVSEAVVAIPFYVEGSEVKYFDIDSGVFSKAQTNRAEGVEDSTTKSVEDLISKVEKFVFPPIFDFVTNIDVTPISMYVFEFTHTFNQDDLAHIWQNLPPKVARQPMKARSTINHRLLSDALMGSTILDEGIRLKDKIQWMVFKVKQRAAKDYYATVSKVSPKKLTAGDSSTTLEQVSLATGVRTKEFLQTGQGGMPDYSYNWPYDFFSLIEFASIDATVDFELPEEEDVRYGGRTEGIPDTPARINAPERVLQTEQERLPDDLVSPEPEPEPFGLGLSDVDETWYEEEGEIPEDD